MINTGAALTSMIYTQEYWSSNIPFLNNGYIIS